VGYTKYNLKNEISQYDENHIFSPRVIRSITLTILRTGIKFPFARREFCSPRTLRIKDFIRQQIEAPSLYQVDPELSHHFQQKEQ
jgi:hypothetical protein